MVGLNRIGLSGGVATKNGLLPFGVFVNLIFENELDWIVAVQQNGVQEEVH